MRETKGWRKEECQKLQKDEELKEYVAARSGTSAKIQGECRRLAELVVDVELGLTLLEQVAPAEPAMAVDALLSGYRFPMEALKCDANWERVQKARFYLVGRKGRQWRRSLEEYIQLPESLKNYQLNAPDGVPTRRATDNSSLWELYRKTLETTPGHEQWNVELADEGRWYCKVSPENEKGGSIVEITIDIPKAVADIQRQSTVALTRTRTEPENPAQTVTWEELLLDAGEMDCKLEASGQEAQNYHVRLQNIDLHIYNDDTKKFALGSEISFDKLTHIVGLLNVGKSALIEVLIYHLAKQKYRCALIVNDVVSAVRLASLFSHGLEIAAAPVLGQDRQGHLAKVYESVLANSGEEITQGGMHPAWRWFSPVCPLLALVKSEAKWEFGSEPCHALYKKVSDSKNKSEKGDADDRESRERYTCPLYYKCPRHQLDKDLAKALVWFLTPASFVHTRVPRHGFEKKITFAEAVYRECQFLFIDEADRVQVHFDQAFAPNEVLVEQSENALLNQIGLNFANTIYSSDRRSLAGDLLAAGKKANDYVQIATDIIAGRLYTQSKLVEWLGQDTFTGRSLFARIVRELVKPPGEEQKKAKNKPKLSRQQRMEQRAERIQNQHIPAEQRDRRKALLKTLEKFLQYPLDRRRGDRELSDLALRLLNAEPRNALAEVEDWSKNWLQDKQVCLPEGEEFQELISQIHFAIITTVLEDRLAFVVDRIPELSRAIDLHEVSEALVRRPPRDFLPVLPTSPVGNILGFVYKRDRRSSKGGKLEYFRYVGVGRSLLLNFPFLFASDRWEGPHTAIVSGTSYAPGSPAYHVRVQPTVLLKPKANNGSAGDAGIAQSEFRFKPMKRIGDDRYIALSGLPPARRLLQAEEMVKAMCHSHGNIPRFLDEIFEELKQKAEQNREMWGDRQRILMITGSYDEADWVTSILQRNYSRYHVEQFIEPGAETSSDNVIAAALVRDSAPDDKKGLRRGKVQGVKDTPYRILVAPLLALERGHNILNEDRKAAFGAALFLNRPMPVPDDWQSTVRQLNDWAILNAEDPDFYQSANSESQLTLTEAYRRFYNHALAQMLNLNCTAWSFKQLTDDERSVLCSTQLVSIWQIIGRLVRGGVPALVYFLDLKFAPQSAEGEQDDEKTSLLVAMIKELESYMQGEGKQPYEIDLSQALYFAFAKALKNTRRLNYA